MADLVAVKEVDYVSINSVENQLLAVDGDKVSIVEIVPEIVEAQSTSLELVYANESQNIVFATDPIILLSDDYDPPSTGTGGVNIWDEGTLVAKNVTDINFAGADVLSKSTGNGKVTVFIPTPTYVSHFNFADGVNSCLIPDVTVANRYVSIPTTEGTPFAIGDWAEQQIHQVVSSPILTYQTPVPCSFFDTTTTFTVTVLGPDGSTTVTSFQTPAISSNATYISPDNVITLSISGWNTDSDKFQASVAITVNVGILYPMGGRFGVSMSHSDSTEGTFFKVQNNLFYDANTNAANIAGTSIAQKWVNSSKYLSGIRYFSLGDVFDISCISISNINSNSYPDTVVSIVADDFGIDPISLSATDLQNWTSAWDNQNASFEGMRPITLQNHRFVGDAYIQTSVLDWGVASTVASIPLRVTIDTYPQSSDPLVENFEDEYYRQQPDFNSGYPYGNWLSDSPLQQGDAMVFGGQLIAPSQAHTIDHSPSQPIQTWADFNPYNDSGNPNPDYSSFTVPVNYYRTFVTPDPNRDEANWQIYVDGEFVNGDVNQDITAGLIEIYLRRVASTMTDNVGPTATPMYVQGYGYNLGTFDDGVTDGCIRTGNSAGNMIGCTSGGLTTHGGLYFHLRILDERIKIDKVRFEFN